MYNIKHEQFEGPLDVLLKLIESEKMNINEISLAKVADGYLEFIKSIQEIDKEELAEFLVIASQLILIKSRSLLPNLQISDEETVSIEELERRLAEYQKLKELSKDIKNIWVKGSHIHTREFYSGRQAVFYPPLKVSTLTLMRVFEEVVAAIPKIEKLVEEKIRKIISLEEKMKELQSLLQEKIERAFSELISAGKDKIEVIVSFLAVLELAKQKFLSLSQDKLFGEIKIRKEHHE